MAAFLIAGARTALALPLLDGAEKQVQRGVQDVRIGRQVIAQALGEGEDPLPHRQSRYDILVRLLIAA